MKVNNTPNLAAYICVDSDPGPNYGKMTVLKVPTSTVIQGPEQVANIFTTNADDLARTSRCSIRGRVARSSTATC